MKKQIWNAIIILLALVAVITVSLAVTSAAKNAKAQEWHYTRMGVQVNYSIGERAEYLGRIYECVKWDPSDPAVMVPPGNSDWWAEVQ